MTSSNYFPTCRSVVQRRRALPMGISSNTLAYRVTLANHIESCIQCFFFVKLDWRSHVWVWMYEFSSAKYISSGGLELSVPFTRRFFLQYWGFSQLKSLISCSCWEANFFSHLHVRSLNEIQARKLQTIVHFVPFHIQWYTWNIYIIMKQNWNTLLAWEREDVVESKIVLALMVKVLYS